MRTSRGYQRGVRSEAFVGRAPRRGPHAATVLLVLGISQRAVMGLMGWSTNAMTTRYQHLTPDLRRDIAHQVDELLWTDSWTDETRDETTNVK